MEKQVNYTESQVAQIVEAYASGVSVEDLAVKMGKSTRSIIAKLSREGVYKKAQASTSKRVTKADLIVKIAAALDVEAAKLESLEKGSLEALQLLAEKVVFENATE